MRPYETGVTYGNFLDLDGASADRVRAAYSPEDCERPVELKNRYDPNNLFRFNRNILPSSAAATASHKTYPHQSRAGSNRTPVLTARDLLGRSSNLQEECLSTEPRTRLRAALRTLPFR
jgi:berberine-like enzyme